MTYKQCKACGVNVFETERHAHTDTSELGEDYCDNCERKRLSACPARQDETKLHCPNCGSPHGVYAKADLRWQDMTQSWEISHIEEQLDCTECDHAWTDTSGTTVHP